MDEVQFIGQAGETGGYYLSPATVISKEEALAHPAYHRQAVFKFVISLDSKLRVLNVETQATKEYFKQGDKFEIDTSGDLVKILVNGKPEGLIRSFDLSLSPILPHTLTLTRYNLDSKVHTP